MTERERIREQLESTWDAEAKWEGDFVRPSVETRERWIDDMLIDAADRPGFRSHARGSRSFDDGAMGDA